MKIPWRDYYKARNLIKELNVEFSALHIIEEKIKKLEEKIKKSWCLKQLYKEIVSKWNKM